MSRLFWVALGAAAGVAAIRKVSKVAHGFTPQGAAGAATRAAGGLGEALREFVDEVRAGMAEREDELHEALGIDGASIDAEGRY